MSRVATAKRRMLRGDMGPKLIFPVGSGARRAIFCRHSIRVSGGGDAITPVGTVYAGCFGSKLPKIDARFSSMLLRARDTSEAINDGLMEPCLQPRVDVPGFGTEQMVDQLVTKRVLALAKRMNQLEAFVRGLGQDVCREVAYQLVDTLTTEVFANLWEGDLALITSHEPLILLAVWALTTKCAPIQDRHIVPIHRRALDPLEGFELIQEPKRRGGKIMVGQKIIVPPLHELEQLPRLYVPREARPVHP